MNFREYQIEADKTAVYPNKGNNITYPSLGLAGETGEVCEKIKKIIRDKNGIVDQESKELIKKEIGDVLWYCAALSKELGLDLQEVADGNISKLKDRQNRNKLKGEGDLR